MGYIILVIFIITAILCYLEDYIKQYRLPLYCLLGFILILVAGLREVGIDPDSENYEYTYQHYYQAKAIDMVEPTFLLISYLLNFITSNVHILFLFYATIGITTKFYAFKKLTKFYFVPVLVFISYYFMLHDMTQIRAGIVSALLLVATYYITINQKKKALILILVGSLFHYSSLTLLPIIFLRNKDFNTKNTIFWALVIPLSYIIFFAGISVLMSTSIPFVGEKLAMYQNSVEKGKLTVAINVFDPIHIISIILFYFIFFYRKTIAIFSNNINIILKIAALGLFFHTSLAFLPVLGLRVSQLYGIVNIILYTQIIYVFKQKWIGITFSILISIFQAYIAIPHYGLGKLILI